MQISHRDRFPESYLNPLSKTDKVSVDTFSTLPSDVFPQIASYADFDTLKVLLEVSKEVNAVVSILNDKRREAVKEVAFGRNEWLEFFGLDTGNEPMLPRDIVEILNNPCPMDPTKEVGATHVFTLIPRDLSFESLGQHVKKYFPMETGYGQVDEAIFEELKAPNEKSYWVLMSKDVFMPKDLPHGSRCKTFERQQEMISELAQNANVNYEIPGVLEAAVSILTHQVRSAKRLFNTNYTRCLEKVNDNHIIVGGFRPSGLFVHIGSTKPLIFIGIAGLRKFRPLVLG